MVFGLTAQGFVPKTFSDVHAEIAEKQATDLGQNLRTDDQSVNGVLTAIVAEREADVWDLLQAVYAAGYKRGATGQALDDLAELVGLSRRAATYSVAELSLSGTPGTLIPAASYSKDGLDTRWVHASDATLDGGGAATVLASPEVAGAVQGLAGTIDEPGTFIAGWAGVTNAEDAEPGQDRQTDAGLRTLMTQAFRGLGGSSAETILATLLERPDVLEAHVIENREVYTTDGLTPHSYECVVRGGDDLDIATAIYAVGGAGIQTIGTTTETVTDSQGKSHEIRFTRTVEIPIYITAEVESDDGFPDDGLEQIEAALLEHGQSLADGADVVPWQFAQKVETPGIANLTIRVGTSPSPSGTSRLTISRRERADIQAANIVAMFV